MTSRRNLPLEVWNYSLAGQLLHYRFNDLSFRVPYLPLIVRREEFMDGQDTGLHQPEDFCVLQFVNAGQGIHIVGGQNYNVMSGDIYIMSPGSNHGFLNYHGIEMYGVYFPLELLTKAETAALRPTNLWKVLAPAQGRRRATGPRRLHLLPEQYRLAEAIVVEINDELRQPPLGVLLAHSALFRLLAMLSRWYDERRQQHTPTHQPSTPESEAEDLTPRASRHAANLSDIIDFCECNFDKPLTAGQLATRMFLSRSQFTRIFTRAVGMSPATYVRQLRLAHAQHLLTTTALKTGEIAAACGLLDATSLSRTFRAEFGVTPTAYRRAHRAR